MSGVEQLGYLGFAVSDVPAWRAFATDILGLVVVDDHGDAGFGLRLDKHAVRFLIRPGAADDLSFVGLECGSRAEAERLAVQVEAAGCAIEPGSAEAVAARHCAGFFAFTEPGGTRMELYWNPEIATAPFASKRCAHGFKADALGLGHFVLRALDLEASLKFITEVLEFELSDRIICDIGGYHVNIAFTHCNPRHHSIALGQNLPKHIHHFMLECNHIDDVGACFDRVVNAGMPVWNAIGRHPNDRMLSFYCETPSGFQFEYGWGGLEIDDETWETTVYDRISDWGHEHPGAIFKKLFRRHKNEAAAIKSA